MLKIGNRLSIPQASLTLVWTLAVACTFSYDLLEDIEPLDLSEWLRLLFPWWPASVFLRQLASGLRYSWCTHLHYGCRIGTVHMCIMPTLLIYCLCLDWGGCWSCSLGLLLLNATIIFLTMIDLQINLCTCNRRLRSSKVHVLRLGAYIYLIAFSQMGWELLGLFWYCWLPEEIPAAAQRLLLVFKSNDTRISFTIIHREVKQEGPLEAPVFLCDLCILSLLLIRPSDTFTSSPTTSTTSTNSPPLVLCSIVYIELHLARLSSMSCRVRSLVVHKGVRYVLKLLGSRRVVNCIYLLLCRQWCGGSLGVSAVYTWGHGRDRLPCIM